MKAPTPFQWLVGFIVVVTIIVYVISRIKRIGDRELLYSTLNLPEMVGPARMTYDSAISYFIEHRPPDGAQVVRGAMIRQVHPHGIAFIQVFLSEDNKPIVKLDGSLYGRKLIVQELDDELLSAFGNKELVIVK